MMQRYVNNLILENIFENNSVSEINQLENFGVFVGFKYRFFSEILEVNDSLI
jgi:hypothetical protein